MKIVKSREQSRLLIKGISETIKNEPKEQKGGFLSMLLGTLTASLLESALTRRVVVRAGEGTIKAGECMIRAGGNFLTNFEIQRYYHNEPKFLGVNKELIRNKN